MIFSALEQGAEIFFEKKLNILWGKVGNFITFVPTFSLKSS